MIRSRQQRVEAPVSYSIDHQLFQGELIVEDPFLPPLSIHSLFGVLVSWYTSLG